MVVKKNNIQKQKGGELGELRIPDKLKYYFYIALELLKRYSDLLNNRNENVRQRNQQFEDLQNYIKDYSLHRENHLVKKLNIELLLIFNQGNTTIESMIEKFKISIDIILQTLFSDIYIDTSITFPSKLIKIYIHILFIKYVYNNNSNKNTFKSMLNTLKKNNRKNIICRLLERHNNSFNPQTEINYIVNEKLRRMFLEEYPTIYGVPVFYGNINDDLNAETRKYIGYNQFICEKVGVSSSEKRKYTINPVGAIAWMFIDKDDFIGTPLYELLGKILRFNYDRTRGNKRTDSYNGNLPKLVNLHSNTTKFCIAKNEFLEEEIYEEPRNDVSMCSITFGCSLKMTAIIRKENIAPNEDILQLLHILLDMYLKNENMFLITRPKQDFPPNAQQLSVSRGQGAAAAAAPPLMRRAISRNITNNLNILEFKQKISAEIKRIQTAINRNHNLTYRNISNLQNHIGILKDVLINEPT